MNNLRVIATWALGLAVSVFAIAAVDQHWLELWNAAQASDAFLSDRNGLLIRKYGMNCRHIVQGS